MKYTNTATGQTVDAIQIVPENETQIAEIFGTSAVVGTQQTDDGPVYYAGTRNPNVFVNAPGYLIKLPDGSTTGLTQAAFLAGFIPAGGA